MRSLALKIPPNALGLLLALLLWAAARSAPALGFARPVRRVMAIGLATLGASIALLGVISFRRARTTMNPLIPEAAPTLVVLGIYRLTRHLMNLGMLLMLSGWAVFLTHALALLLTNVMIPLMNRLQIVPEEKTGWRASARPTPPTSPRSGAGSESRRFLPTPRIPWNT